MQQLRTANTAETCDTTDLVSSANIIDTPVFGPNGARIGSVDHMMIGKRSGQVRFVIIAYGGFLGLGEDHFPLPWHSLTYDETKDGYTINFAVELLNQGPKYHRDAKPDWSGTFGRQVVKYYGAH